MNKVTVQIRSHRENAPDEVVLFEGEHAIVAVMPDISIVMESASLLSEILEEFTSKPPHVFVEADDGHLACLIGALLSTAHSQYSMPIEVMALEIARFIHSSSVKHL